MCGSSSTKVTVTGNRVLGNMAHAEIQISSGYDFVVLEGQPGYSNLNNRLEGRSNGANKSDAFSSEMGPHDGRTMAQFAGDLQLAAASYKNDLTYSFPSIRYGLSNLNGGYNSNSYVGGVLDAAAPGAGLRYVVQEAASRNGFRIPGMENPIPLVPVK